MVEINDDAGEMHNTNSQIKFKTSMLNSRLCNYTDAYVLVKGTISIAPVPPSTANPNNNNKEAVFKNFALFTECIGETNNTQIDNAKDIDVVMPKHNLIEYSNIMQYNRDEPFLDVKDAIADFFAANNNSALFKCKQKKS